MTIMDTNMNIIDCNQVALDMFNVQSKTDVIGGKVLNYITEIDRQRAQENINRILQQKLFLSNQ